MGPVKQQSVNALGAALLLVLAVGVVVGQRDEEPGPSQRVALPSSRPFHPLGDEADAKRVRARLAALPGVGAAEMALGSDDAASAAIGYGVEMRELATDAAVLRVVKAAYRAFNRDFAGTSASLEINRLNDAVTLETRKPTATEAEVMRIARYAFTEAADDDLVEVSIRARDDLPHPLLGKVRVNLLGGHARTPTDVLERLDAVDLARLPPHTGLGVTDDAGDGLTSDVGLPSQQDRANWAALNDDPFPARVGFDLSAGTGENGQRIWYINAEIEATRVQDGADPAELAALLRHTLDVMRSTEVPFWFYGVVGLAVERSIWFDSTTCELTGPDWLDEVKQDYFDDGPCG